MLVCFPVLPLCLSSVFVLSFYVLVQVCVTRFLFYFDSLSSRVHCVHFCRFCLSSLLLVSAGLLLPVPVCVCVCVLPCGVPVSRCSYGCYVCKPSAMKLFWVLCFVFQVVHFGSDSCHTAENGHKLIRMCRIIFTKDETVTASSANIRTVGVS